MQGVKVLYQEDAKMSYFLKRSNPSKKGLYLQIYENKYIPGKGNRNRSVQAIGYVCELIEQGISDPEKYAQGIVDKLNEKAGIKKRPEIGDSSASKNIGYSLLKYMIDFLEVDETLRIMSQNAKFRFKLSDFLRSMIYAQVVNPGSKHNAFENVLPNIYGAKTFSYDQILDTTNYIGQDYAKFVELFNHQINLKFGRNTENVLFDCTNYYFEIDLPSEDRQKGPSKDNKKEPIIGQALMLDSDQIPIGMKMYPGNQSEKPLIRETIEDMKSRYDISGRVIQVADKGLNCARNIYAAVKEADDGYIFSKAIRGSALPTTEKEWILLENEHNIWHEVSTKNGKYFYKEDVDYYDYHCFVNEDDDRETNFTVFEKRIVTYNPSLAQKQRSEILKEVEKAKRNLSLKNVCREEYGDCSKYVAFDSTTKDGKKVKIKGRIDEKKVEEDLKYCGYNMLVTSETKKSAEEIYKAYHSLWRIEESFRIMKTYLEARPVYLSKKESIYGHFLICYLALTTIRLLELKVFHDEIPASKLIEFIRNFSITEGMDGNFINGATKSETHSAIKEALGLTKIGYLYLTKKDVENILNYEI